MKLLRSWPANVPDGRAYVVDQMPRIVMDNYDYRVLGDVDDDVLLIEWDLAIGKEDLAAFAARAAAAPQRVLVAPYRLYHYASNRDRTAPIWVHRRYIGTPETGTLVHVQEGDPTCNLWGLGMTYLPRDLIRRFLAAWPALTVSDGSLSGWHHRNVEPDVPITWDIRPVHLHYQLPPIA